MALNYLRLKAEMCERRSDGLHCNSVTPTSFPLFSSLSSFLLPSILLFFPSFSPSLPPPLPSSFLPSFHSVEFYGPISTTGEQHPSQWWQTSNKNLASKWLSVAGTGVENSDCGHLESQQQSCAHSPETIGAGFHQVQFPGRDCWPHGLSWTSHPLCIPSHPLLILYFFWEGWARRYKKDERTVLFSWNVQI